MNTITLTCVRPLARRLRGLRIRAQAGFALPMALVTMTIVTGLAGVTVMVATQGNDSTNHDASVKAADEAAESALDVATYRLNMIQPTSGNCITGNQVSSGAGGWCQDTTTETLGNGASFTYWNTTGSPASCVGYTLVNQAGLTQRCVTAQATVDGVTRRQQARVAEYAATPLFPYAGVIGLNWVDISGHAGIGGVVATNGALTASGGATATGTELGPSGSAGVSGGASIGTVAQRTAAQGPIVLSPVDPGNSATVNSDQRITNGTLNPKVTPYDSSSGNIGWTAGKRTLNMSGGSSLTLGGGVYNFCSLQISGGSTLTIAAGVTAQIFIDSSKRSGSGCGSGAGVFNVSGNGSIVNPSDNPVNVQIYIYDDSGGTAQLSGQAIFYGTLYAPSSDVNLSGGAGDVGAVAGATVTMSGGSFSWDSREATLAAGTAGLYYRTAWEACQPPTAATMNSPSSGC